MNNEIKEFISFSKRKLLKIIFTQTEVIDNQENLIQGQQKQIDIITIHPNELYGIASYIKKYQGVLEVKSERAEGQSRCLLLKLVKNENLIY